MSLLIKNINEIYTANSENQIIKNAYILIKNNKINEIGQMKQLENKNLKYSNIIDARDNIALPGFINTHTHAGMSLLRGYADDLPLKEWLENKIWPFEKGLSADDIYWGSLLSIMEMIKTGTTTFVDMYFQMDKVAEIVKKTGIRAVLTQGLIEEKDGLQGLEKAKDFSLKWNNKAQGRIKTMFAPHAPYTCSPEYLNKIKNIAIDNDSAINIHIAETKNEFEFINDKYDYTPVQLLDSIDFFDVPVLAAHCIYVNDDDINILKEKNVGIAYNPLSNMKLASGIAPINLMLKKGINIGFGTDGVGSNNNLDIIEEARVGSYLQKVKNLDPTVINKEDILKMLTIKGARAANLNNLGLIKNDMLADIILINIKDNTRYYPHHNNLSNLFYAGSGNDINTVIINGKIIYHNNELISIDSEKVYYEVEKRSKILAQ